MSTEPWYKVTARNFTSSYMHDRTPFMKKLVRTYEVGSIVTAQPKSVGLYIFKHRPDAESFRAGGEKILKVQPVDKPVSCRLAIEPEAFNRISNFYKYNKALKDNPFYIVGRSYLCKQLYVIEEIQV